MDRIVIKQGEAKTVTFTVTDTDGEPVDLAAATLFLGIKKDKSDTAYTFSHEDADFDKTQAADGLVAVALTAEDTNQEEGPYVGELKCSWAGPVIKKSEDFFLQIKRAVT
jgi:hypothetical protein